MRAQRLWLIGFVVLLTAQAQATSLGVFCWQLSPTVDVVCFNIEDASLQARTFALFGTESVVGSYRYPATGGVAFDEYAGLYRMNWVTYFNEIGNSGQVSFGANLNPQTLQGPFFSSFGAEGTMLFLGAGIAAAAGSARSIDENQMDQQTLLEQVR